MSPWKIDREIEEHLVELRQLSDLIHSHPELGFAEHIAHDGYVQLLQKLNFSVTPHAFGIPTSFQAEYGNGGRLVILNAEYDALPGIGHACGHNLIGVASLAAFLSVASQLKASGRSGRVRLLGTPAEEGGGGKILLLSKGAYDGADAALMAHPCPLNGVQFPDGCGASAYVRHTALSSFIVEFRGHTAHAAAAPWEGVNALDAMVLAYNGISVLRQQIRPEERIHGIITNGGKRANIIPDYTKALFDVRAPTVAAVAKLKDRVYKCFEAAAVGTGCTYSVTERSTYADVQPNRTMCSLFTEEMDVVGMRVLNNMDPQFSQPASTDFGNVSYIVPSIHPNYGIIAKPGSGNHTAGFHNAAGADDAFQRSMAIASGLAGTTWKILTDNQLADEIKAEFESDHRTRRDGGDTKWEQVLIEWLDDMEPEVTECTCGHDKS